jgi:phosphoglucosamine mutase
LLSDARQRVLDVADHQLRFGTDGVRGVAYSELTPEFATRLGRAAAQVLRHDHPESAVVIGGDTRESTPDIESALATGFTAEGIDVVRLGVVPTPMVAFEANRRMAMGAVVSASHNPYRDNGIKLFARGGTKLTDEVESEIESELDLPSGSGADRPGAITGSTDHDPYVDHVLTLLGERRFDGLRVVLDCANGAATVVGPKVLRAAGADLTVIADQPDGRNINELCGATHPATVAAAVVAYGADVGVALDGDADRLIAVDHTGAIVDGDHVIAICAGDLRDRGLLRHETVVVTVMANLGFRLAMREQGIGVVETAVGDRYVLEALAAHGLSLGGEQSGHVIFADHATTGDGILTAVALLDVAARANRPLADIAAAAMTSLPQVLVNERVARTVPDVAEQMEDEIAAVEAELGESGRVLVRASGTEPLVRVMVEAATEPTARSVAEGLASIVRHRFG